MAYGSDDRQLRLPLDGSRRVSHISGRQRRLEYSRRRMVAAANAAERELEVLRSRSRYAPPPISIDKFIAIIRREELGLALPAGWRICRDCLEPFDVRNGRYLYCSPQCSKNARAAQRKLAKRAAKAPITCVICGGAPYISIARGPQPQHICSDECAAELRLRTTKRKNCANCGETFIATRGRVTCSPECKRERERKRDRERGNRHERRRLTKMQPMYEAQDGKCNRCGIALPILHFTIDRIIPGSQGGTYEPSNTHLLCGRCNSAKRDRIERKSN